MLERIGDAFPGSIPIDDGVLNCLAAPLQIAVAHRGIQVSEVSSTSSYSFMLSARSLILLAAARPKSAPIGVTNRKAGP